ncbi:MAG TPA: hypothetical protein VN043_07915 [Rhodanobacter sp.]|nr:hypothetical protein [Rhodanobacter sp.]
MKLLRDFFRHRMAGARAVSGRRQGVPPAFNVTVPAPLAKPASDVAEVLDLPPPHTPASRPEPASFLKAARHRRLGAGH